MGLRYMFVLASLMCALQGVYLAEPVNGKDQVENDWVARQHPFVPVDLHLNTYARTHTHA